MRDAIQELADIVGRLETSWNDHDCKADEEAHANGYDEGRADLKKRLLDQIETWKRQAAIGLVPGTWSLEEMKDWVNRA